ncbi:hypothetical protein LEP1GSC133_2869 [Leptospira borgpetersenii serovar Pomona str. 200901868]|uniref:Uncharacterized protein n=1 Tax=Leptospira borgpetersenii serovar Pomona str. 200901868 TaxID=1192866 RepID=M6W586_LEPBO|nr:hypothetical protein LEP1GSC133_2869 [Leptospira borgpetersenii serovar Pomona str. 200901868]
MDFGSVWSRSSVRFIFSTCEEIKERQANFLEKRAVNFLEVGVERP